MLQRIQDKSKGWITYVVVGFLVIVFVMWGIGYYLKGFSGPASEAGEVNGKSISLADFNRAYQAARSQEKGPLGEADVQHLKNTVLENLIHQTLLSTSAAAMGFTLSDQTVSTWISSDLNFRDEKGHFSPERYHLLLQQLGINAAMLRAQIQKTVMISQVEQGVTQTAFALPEEVKANAAFLDPSRQVAEVRIPLALFENKVPVSEAETKAYYDAHSSEFYAKQSLQIAYLDLKTQEAYSPVFNQLANLSFEHPESLLPAAKALNLPVLTSDYFSEDGGKSALSQNAAVIKAAFSPEVLVDKNNSDLIKLSPTEAIVLRVVAEQKPHLQSFDEVKSTVIHALQKQQAEKLAQAAVESLKSAQDLEAEAKVLGLDYLPAKTYTEKDSSVSPEMKKVLFSPSTTLETQAKRVLLSSDSVWILLEIQPKSGATENASSTQFYQANIRLPGLWGAWEYQAYENGLAHDATIKTFL